MAPAENSSIEVRCLNGESIIIAIGESASISDLKDILNNSFLPAKNSQNFHLFYKGSKMSLNRRLDSLNISKGEFIVLIPYVKKSQQIPSSNGCVKESIPPSVHSNKSTSDSAWLDIMEDLSNLPHTSSSEPLITDAYEEPLANIKRKRNDCNEQSLDDILSSDSKDIFDQKTSNDISQFVNLVNCLMDSKTGRCMLLEKFGKMSGNESCVCPLWLKKLIKCFRVLNILYAFFRAQQQCFTWSIIEKVIENSSSFGLVDVCISDVENISILCPKLVVILKGQKNMELKPGSAIIIDDSSGEPSAPCGSKNSRKIVRQRTSTLINAIGRREHAFTNGIQKLIICTLKEKGDARSGVFTTLSLSSLLDLIKNSTSVTRNNDVKSAKPKSHASKCQGIKHLGPSEMVDHLREGIGIDGQMVHIECIDAKEAVYVDLPDDLSDNCRTALKRIGISRLYCHQAEAIKASLSGKNTVVATSTSSGKSLCYNVPVLEALSQNNVSCALYIFPTKALAQDQLRALLHMTDAFNVEICIGVYDGDTFQDKRAWIKDNARLLITNPDMLHTSILPHHKNFQRFLSNLRTIVVDEAHVYKGAFGCHTALVLRRLRRICSHVYGSEPSFIFSTATSANPCEHAMELADLHSLELIQNDGSPSSKKYFLLWNPPLRVGSNLGRKDEKKPMKKEFLRRSSPILEASHLFAEMVRHGLRCITFCKTRKLSELVLCYTREILQESCENLVDSICVYRGGYTPEERRCIESKFFGGNLLGIAATNALELGIDVGHIDATLHLGFPGSVSSLWQQAGRSGRRSKPSLAIYIAFEGPLDQYFMKFPHKLFKRPIEHCQVDGKNREVLEQHLACAAVELPLCTQYDEKYFGPGLNGAICCLKNKGILISEQLGTSLMKMWNYIGPEEKPSTKLSLRAIESQRYKVIEESNNEILEEIEESKAFFQVYEGAVYMHQGFTYLVKTLDLSEKIAYCRRADVKYYTKTRDSTTIHITGGNLVYPQIKKSISEHVKTTAKVNPCKVTTKWFGFHRIWKSSNEIYDTVELHLPDFSYDSQAVWIRVSQSIKEDVEKEGFSFRAGLHAASHALLNTVPLYVMCNTSDLSTECVNPHETRSSTLGRLLLYDKHPGGIGLVAQIQVLFKELLVAAQELVSGCSCLSNAGCPNCVQALLCSEYNEVIDKEAAIIILKGVIEAEDAYN